MTKLNQRDIESSRPTRHLVDDDVSTRGGALPEEGVPRETPDTQESLNAPDGAFRIDENEGEGPRHATPDELVAEADGLVISDTP